MKIISNSVIKIIFLFSGLIFSLITYAAQPSAGFNAWVFKNMQQYHIPGASIAVIKDYKLLWAQGYGYANVAEKKPVTPTTLFQAASISKSFTALAALMTFELRDYSIDDNINKYLRSWKVPKNNLTRKKPVTLSELLSHSAGTDVRFYTGFIRGTKLPSTVELLNGFGEGKVPPVTVTHLPGIKYQYSGGGYLIVQQLLQDLYHQPYAELMETLILGPFDMKHSTFDQPLPDYLMKDIATPYITSGKPLTGGPRVFVAAGVGGLWTTPSDLAKFVIALQRSLAEKPDSFPSNKLAKALIKATITPNQSMGFQVSMNKYGKPVRNGEYFMHGGFNSGYLALMIGSVEDGNGAVIMINSAPENMATKNVPQWGFIMSTLKHINQIYHWK